ncbi:MAG: 50S ribosomal protein L17 [Patescibacteria group bacterium]
MRHKKKNLKMNMQRDERAALLRNLATSVILFEKVKTTASRARQVKPVVEKLITTAKGSDKMHAIREINKVIFDKQAGKKLVDVLSERYKDRPGGYTRTLKVGFRSGDSAPVVQLQLVND